MIFSPAPYARVSYLIERASEGNVKSAVLVESWPRYIELQLDGADICYSVAWEAIFQVAEAKHERNLRVEAAEAQKFPRRKNAN